MHRNMSILYVKSGMNIGENEGGFKTCSANDSIVVKDGNRCQLKFTITRLLWVA